MKAEKLLTLKVLKNLTQAECVGLAKFLYPEFNWRFFKPVYDFQRWEGYEVVAGNFIEPTGFKTLFRIDYREDVNQESPRITMYYNGNRDEPPSLELVTRYLRKIGKIS